MRICLYIFFTRAIFFWDPGIAESRMGQGTRGSSPVGVVVKEI